MKSIHSDLRAPRQRTGPLIERLESRTLLSSTAPAAVHPKAVFPVSDVLGAAAGFAIWQNGGPVVPGATAAPAAGAGASLGGSPLNQPGNGTLFATAMAPAGSSIFSVLPILPPDGLAAQMLGLINPFDPYGTVIPSKGPHTTTGSSGLG